MQNGEYCAVIEEFDSNDTRHTVIAFDPTSGQAKLDVGKTATQSITLLGTKGWEMVSVTSLSGDLVRGAVIYTFKRPLPAYLHSQR